MGWGLTAVEGGSNLGGSGGQAHFISMMADTNKVQKILIIYTHTSVGSFEEATKVYLHLSISTGLMRPRRPKQFCLQFYLAESFMRSLRRKTEQDIWRNPLPTARKWFCQTHKPNIHYMYLQNNVAS